MHIHACVRMNERMEQCNHLYYSNLMEFMCVRMNLCECV